MKKIIKTFKELYKKIKWKIKLWDMDRQYALCCGSCFALFSPSFYCRHTPEEVDKITGETIEEIKKMIDELEP